MTFWSVPDEQAKIHLVGALSAPSHLAVFNFQINEAGQKIVTQTVATSRQMLYRYSDSCQHQLSEYNSCSDRFVHLRYIVCMAESVWFFFFSACNNWFVIMKYVAIYLPHSTECSLSQGPFKFMHIDSFSLFWCTDFCILFCIFHAQIFRIFIGASAIKWPKLHKMCLCIHLTF